MKILVTGGAGYVGSHTVRMLLEQNHQVLVLDNLEKGHAKSVIGAQLVLGNTSDIDLVNAIINSEKIDCVMHFAAYMEVNESMLYPERYYANNTGASSILVRACIEAGVKNFIFSSTCAIYGQPQTVPITEEAEKDPLSVYGHSKLLTEEMLAYLSKNSNFRYIALRYFNAAGAHQSGNIGEDHFPESHLIPIILQVALGVRSQISIFGSDYPTPDGTCVRDYIHVSDLARGHIAAMHYLAEGGKSNYFNIATGKGQSVKKIIEVCRKVTGKDIPAIEEARRSGDPPELFAEAGKIREILDWKARESEIDQLIASAWKWHKNHPNGYRIKQ